MLDFVSLQQVVAAADACEDAMVTESVLPHRWDGTLVKSVRGKQIAAQFVVFVRASSADMDSVFVLIVQVLQITYWVHAVSCIFSNLTGVAKQSMSPEVGFRNV